MKTLTVNSITYFIEQKSKYTVVAHTTEELNNRVTSAPSIPKLENKIKAILQDNNKPSTKLATTAEDTDTTKKEKSKKTKKQDKKKTAKLAKENTKLAKTKKDNKSNKPKKTSMRQLTLELILAGKDDHEILAEVERIMKEENRDMKYDLSHVKWYRSRFTTDGIISAEFAPKKSKAYQKWLEEQDK